MLQAVVLCPITLTVTWRCILTVTERWSVSSLSLWITLPLWRSFVVRHSEFHCLFCELWFLEVIYTFQICFKMCFIFIYPRMLSLNLLFLSSDMCETAMYGSSQEVTVGGVVMENLTRTHQSLKSLIVSVIQLQQEHQNHQRRLVHSVRYGSK